MEFTTRNRPSVVCCCLCSPTPTTDGATELEAVRNLRVSVRTCSPCGQNGCSWSACPRVSFSISRQCSRDSVNVAHEFFWLRVLRQCHGRACMLATSASSHVRLVQHIDLLDDCRLSACLPACIHSCMHVMAPVVSAPTVSQMPMFGMWERAHNMTCRYAADLLRRSVPGKH